MSPKGHATLKVGEKEYRLRLGFSEIADADEFLGRSLTSAFTSDPGNFHILRTAFYFAARGQHGMKGVKDAGHVLDSVDIVQLGEAILGALKAGGLIGEAEGEA
jgi:hypothetical protein